MGKKSIRVNSDGQVLVIEQFITEEVLIQLDRKQSQELALKILKAQGIKVALP